MNRTRRSTSPGSHHRHSNHAGHPSSPDPEPSRRAGAPLRWT
ncbi:hypothetical protein [Streptomyces ferrugineus]|nr:hypothetical protein [Streptomyces ferrugineus]